MKADNKIDGHIPPSDIEISMPRPNFVLAFDNIGYEDPLGLQFEFSVKKTITARIKYWLLCKFFPFKIVRWDA